MKVKGLQIALTGNMRSGKDTVAQYLIEHYGFNRFAFGDGIVDTTKNLFPNKYTTGEKPRKLLQDFGQYCVAIDKNVWVDYLFRAMFDKGIDPVVDNVVITDLRQPHEYEKLKETGFTIVRVEANPSLRKKRIIESGEVFSEETFRHSTEQFVKDFKVDYVIDNNHTTEKLHKQIDSMILDMIGGF